MKNAEIISGIDQYHQEKSELQEKLSKEDIWENISLLRCNKRLQDNFLEFIEREPKLSQEEIKVADDIIRNICESGYIAGYILGEKNLPLKVVQENEIVFSENSCTSGQDWEENITKYTYDKNIHGHDYRFILSCILGIDSSDDEVDNYFGGRIDFSLKGSIGEAITNIGLGSISKEKPIIEDFFVFLRSIGGTKYLIVESSKTSIRFETLDIMREKVMERIVMLQEHPDKLDKDFCGQYRFPKLGMNDLEYKDGFVYVEWQNNFHHPEKMTIDKFFSLLLGIVKDEANEERLAEIVWMVTEIDGDRKKQIQRLKLYERILTQCGFSIYRDNENTNRFTAEPGREFLQSHFPPYEVSENVKKIIGLYMRNQKYKDFSEFVTSYFNEWAAKKIREVIR